MHCKSSCAAALAALVVLAGCTDGPVSPVVPHLPPSAALTLPDGTVPTFAPAHLVLFEALGVPADFATSVSALGGTVERVLSVVGAAMVSGLDATAVTSLQADTRIRLVEPEAVHVLPDDQVTDQPLSADALPASPGAPATAFFYARQWHLRAIGADKAWTAGLRGSPGVTVAILDTGIGYTHADLAGRVDLSRSVSFVPQDDAIVTTVFPGAHLIADIGFHGTHVAATVASNALAAAGVTSQTTLIGVKVCSIVLGVCPASGVYAGIAYAVDHGADIINMSLGGAFQKKASPGHVAVLNRLFNYARQTGVTVVVAAGNARADLDHDLYPDETGVLTHFPSLYATYCTTPHNVCVSATGPTGSSGVNGPWVNIDAPAPYTNYGRSVVNVAAPGGSTGGPVWAACSPFSLLIPVCRTGTFIVGISGTSMAAPHVSGVAALIMGQRGKLPPNEVSTLLQQTSDDLGQAGTDPFYGKGRVNAARALGLP